MGHYLLVETVFKQWPYNCVKIFIIFLTRDIYFSSPNERFCLESPENLATALESFSELQKFKVRYPYSEDINAFPQNALTLLSLLRELLVL
jgi:hypothetical protein